jgi:hypothetical protein
LFCAKHKKEGKNDTSWNTIAYAATDISNFRPIELTKSFSNVHQDEGENTI